MGAWVLINANWYNTLAIYRREAVRSALPDRCRLKQRCCPKAPERKVPRDVNEAAREHARSLVDTEPYAQSRRERKKVETLFAHLKRHLGFGKLRLRGLSGAQDEFLLQNLKRLAKLAAIPPPAMPIA